MEKMKVNKEVFDSLNRALKVFGRSGTMRKNFINKNNGGWSSDSYSPLNELSINDITHCLYIGYKVEETKEEFISRIYKDYEKENTIHSKGFCNGIKFTLNALEIKIEGVN